MTLSSLQNSTMASHRDFPNRSDPKELIKIEDDDHGDESGEEEEEDDESVPGEIRTPAAAAHRSDCTSSTAKKCAAKYKIPAEFGLCAPTADQRVHAPPPGYAAVYTHHLLHGLRLPLPEFVISVMDYYKIALTQLHPNSISILVGFIDICKRASVAPTTALFRHFFQLRRNRKSFIPAEGWYTIIAKRSKHFLIRSQITKGWGWEKSFLFFKTEPLPEKVALSWNYSPVVDPPLSENEKPSEEAVSKLRASIHSFSKRKFEGSDLKARIVNKIPLKPEEEEMKIDLDAPLASLRRSSRSKKPTEKYEPDLIPCQKTKNLNSKQEITKSTESQGDSCRQKRQKTLAEINAETPKGQTESVKDMNPENLTAFIQSCVGSLHQQLEGENEKLKNEVASLKSEVSLHQKLEGENEKLKNEVASLKAEVSRLQAVADDRGPLLKAYTWKLLKTRAFAEFFIYLTEPVKSLGQDQAAKLIRENYPAVPEEAVKSLENPQAASELDNLFFDMIQDDGFKFPLLDHLLALQEIPSSSELKHLDVDRDEDALIRPPSVPATE